MSEQIRVKWACPKCGADSNQHGEGGSDKCKEHFRARSREGCQGFLCNCDDDGADTAHGETYANPCPNAHCHHCEWEGTFPTPLKLKGLEAWEKKAIAAGWGIPEARKKELGL